MVMLFFGGGGVYHFAMSGPTENFPDILHSFQYDLCGCVWFVIFVCLFLLEKKSGKVKGCT